MPVPVNSFHFLVCLKKTYLPITKTSSCANLQKHIKWNNLDAFYKQNQAFAGFLAAPHDYLSNGLTWSNSTENRDGVIKLFHRVKSTAISNGCYTFCTYLTGVKLCNTVSDDRLVFYHYSLGIVLFLLHYQFSNVVSQMCKSINTDLSINGGSYVMLAACQDA